MAAKLEKHNKVEATRALMQVSYYALARAQEYVFISRSGDEPELRARRQVPGVAEALDIYVRIR